MSFVEELHKSRKTILCCFVLDKIASIFSKRLSIKRARALALILLFILFEIMQLQTLVVLRRPITPVFTPSLFSALIATLSIQAISYGYLNTLMQIEPAIQPSTFAKSLDRKLTAWLKTAANTWLQLMASVLLTVIAVGALFIIDERLGLPFNVLDSAVFSSLVTFWGGQGIYWGWTIPLMTRKLAKSDLSELEIHAMNPSSTPILVAISDALSVLALLIALLITLCLIGMFTLRPSFNKNVMYPILLLFIG